MRLNYSIRTIGFDFKFLVVRRLRSQQPDFNTMVELEAGSSTVSCPLSPDLMITVDPREVNSSDDRKEKRIRGKSVVKKPLDMQLVVGEASNHPER